MAVQEDPTDIFDTSLSNLFEIPPIAFSTSSPTDYHTYTPPDQSNLKPIKLLLPHPPPSLYTTLQANNLWLASVYLSDLLCLGKISVAGQRVAELGAGAGLPGIIASRDGGARSVVSSDWGVDEVISVIKGNFERSKSTGQWAVVGHQWGTDLTPLLEALAKDGKSERFDVLLLADTIWVTAAHQALLDSIFGLLRPGGIAYITAGLHTGRGPLERFIDAAKARYGVVEKMGDVRWRIQGGWENGVESTDGLEEERGVVVFYTLRIPEEQPDGI